MVINKKEDIPIITLILMNINLIILNNKIILVLKQKHVSHRIIDTKSASQNQKSQTTWTSLHQHLRSPLLKVGNQGMWHLPHWQEGKSLGNICGKHYHRKILHACSRPIVHTHALERQHPRNQSEKKIRNKTEV